MAPKAAPPPEPAADPIPEVDEEGEGRIAFRLKVGAVSNLPCELETCVAFSGLCRENRSAPAEASDAPSFSELLTKDTFIRELGQKLYDDVVSTDLVVSLRDTARENAVIGEATLNCYSLLHIVTRVGGELELRLTEDYHVKWFPELEAEREAATGKDKKGGAPKAKAKAQGKPSEQPEEAEKPKRPPGWKPPPTTIEVRVSVDDLVGPIEDRDDWNMVTIRLKGVFGLPERMSSLGITSPDDFEGHQLKYRAVILGESLGNGVLTKPVEVEEPPPEPADGEEPLPAEELPEVGSEAWREREQRFGRSVRFNGGQPTVRYRGAPFLKDFRYMLNHIGGIWLYFTPEEKLGTADPKKPAASEAGPLAKQFAGKAWLDLRSLIWAGTKKTEACCPLVSVATPQDLLPGEPRLEDSLPFAVLDFDLAMEAALPPEPVVEDLRTLVPPRKAANKFPASDDSAAMYREAVERCWSTVSKDCSSGPMPQGVAGVVERLKKTGSYTELRDDLRSAVVQIFRERLRKDVTAVPGKPLEGEQRDALISGTYTYLKRTGVEVLHELRQKEPQSGAPGTPDTASEARPVQAEPKVTLQEGLGAQLARQALSAAVDVAGRNARLAFEAELVGNWDRASSLLQSRLLLGEVRSDPKEWVAFAKFCARSRGRQAAAEEALRQAVEVLAEDGGIAHPAEVGLEVDLMLACLLLDRGRHEEAIRVFRELHEKDLADPMFNFLLGLSLFLSGDEGMESTPLFEVVAKDRSWFAGLPDDAAVVEKLRAVPAKSPNVEPYAACLERLLDFGLPSLAFTFLDQSGVLSKEGLEQEPVALIDAKASALDQDFAAVLQRCEQLTSSGGGSAGGTKGSQEAWRLQGECLYQLGDMDRALQAYNHAMSFERKFEDPAVYIRLGAVLVAKKRWKQAREAYLRSIQLVPTAEAWNGTAYAEYRSEELQPCYEALCEANLLDNERSDIWALLTLVHLRLENWLQADHSFRQCLALCGECEELLLEVSGEFVKCAAGEEQAASAEAAARRALEQRDTPQARAALMEALEKQGKDTNAEQWPS